MGGSKSSSSQSQESLTFTDAGENDVAAGGSPIVVDAGTGKGNITASVNTEGINPADVGTVIDRLIESGNQIIDRQADQAEAQAGAVADIAKAATATQTETGRLIQRLAVPLLIGLAAIVALPGIIRKL